MITDEVVIMIVLFFIFVIAVFGGAIKRIIFEELSNLYESIISIWRWCLISAKHSFKWLYDRPLIYCSGVFAIGLWFGKGYFDFFTMIIESSRDVPR